MTQAIRLQIDLLLSRRIRSKAKQEGITPEELISIYLDYCLIRHKDVIEFERKIDNNTIAKGDKARGSHQDDKQSIPSHLLDWARLAGFKSSNGGSNK